MNSSFYKLFIRILGNNRKSKSTVGKCFRTKEILSSLKEKLDDVECFGSNVE